MTADALFAVTVACTDCGRPTDHNACAWCAHRAVTPKAAGIAAVKGDVEWNHRADAWLASMPIGSIVNADDLIAEAGLPVGSANQVGSKFHRWAKAGWISEHGMTISARRESHSRRILTWQVIA